MVPDNIKTVIEAVRSGDVDRARQLFLVDPSLTRYSMHFDWLTIAVGKKNAPMVKMLLEAGCDPNSSWRGISQPLRKAIYRDCPEIARLLLEHGADPNDNRYALFAIMYRRPHALELIQLLEEFGADLHREFPLGETPYKANALSMAKSWECHDVVAYLESRGAVMPQEPTILPIKDVESDRVTKKYLKYQKGESVLEMMLETEKCREPEKRFAIFDETHCEFISEFDHLQEAIEELQRLSKIPWDAPPNRAPCTSWRTCHRDYVIKDGIELRCIEVLDVSAKGIFWKDGFEPSAKE